MDRAACKIRWSAHKVLGSHDLEKYQQLRECQPVLLTPRPRGGREAACSAEDQRAGQAMFPLG